MSRRYSSSRRRFLGQTLASLGYAALAQGTDFIRIAKAAGERRRRHLVTVTIWGGWDSAWFHNPVSIADLTGLGSLDATYGPKVAISNSMIGFEGADFHKPYKLSVRHRDEEGMMHPSSSSPQFLGSGMKSVFSRDDLRDLLIWKGLKQEGQHGIGNFALVNGANSSYALSFSALVAKGIAEQDYSRPLHYVMVSGKPGDLFANHAMNTGYAIPTCIADQTQLAKLTETDPNDIQDANRRDLLAKVIAELSGSVLGGQLRREASRSVASQFSNAYKNALSIAGSNLTASVEFNYLIKRMYLAILESCRSFFGAGDMPQRQAAIKNYRGDPVFNYSANLQAIASRIGPMPNLAEYRALKRQLDQNPMNADLRLKEKALRDQILPKLRDLPPDPVISSLAYSFGKAAFLVTEDLSAVVDIGGRAGNDPHGQYLPGLIECLATMTGFRELMRVLRETPTVEGTNLLQHTTMVMHTELDRYQWHEPMDLAGRPLGNGTNHAESTSVLMAGMGVRGGEVIGDILKTPRQFPRFLERNHSYLDPLPIDFMTGIAKPLSEGGAPCSTKSVLPTVLRIFGVTVPAQQVTEAGAVPAALKKA